MKCKSVLKYRADFFFAIFKYHSSTMKAFLSLVIAILPATLTFGQVFDPFYASVANNCHQDSVTTYLEQFESLGIKEVNNAALDNTKNWIISKYQDWGYTDIVEDDFNVLGNSTMTNIIVTKTGTVYPDRYVIIDAHYDTQNGPGANDNGSGTVILLELARLIKDIPTEYSIKFIHFSGEEIGFEGSQHYVDNVANATNMDIKIVFNIDQVGGLNGTTNNTIICERDQSPPNGNDAQSAIMTDELVACTQLYSDLLTEISFAYGSDYVPFMQNGYVVTGFYEKNNSPYTHSIQDSIAYMDLPYLYQVTKASMGALLHYAVAYEELDLDVLSSNNFRLYPNPVKESLTIETKQASQYKVQILISDPSGAIIQSSEFEPTLQKFTVDVSDLEPGTYFIRFNNDQGSNVQKFVKY